MGKKTRHEILTDHEQEYLRKSLGRIPTEYERTTITCLWHEFYRRFPYQDIINRARTIQDEVPLADEYDVRPENGLVIEISGNNNEKDLPLAFHALIQKMLLKRCLPRVVIISGSLLNHESAVFDKIVRKLQRQAKDLDLQILPGRTYLSGATAIVDLMLLGIPIKPVSELTNPNQGILVAVNVDIDSEVSNKRIQVLRNNIIQTLKLLISKPWVIRMTDSTARNCANDVVDFLIANQVGIDIRVSSPPDTKVSDSLNNIDRLFLVQIQNGYEEELKLLLSEFGLTYNIIGRIKEVPDYTITASNEILVHIPASLFDPDVSLIEEYSTLYPPEESERQTTEEPLISQKSNYNSQLLKLLPFVNNGNARQYGAYCQRIVLEEPYLIDIGQNQRLSILNQQQAAQILVTESARRMACVGGRPRQVIAHVQSHQDQDPAHLLNFNQVVKGITNACNKLGLQLTGIFSDKLTTVQHCSPSIGIVGTVNPRRKPVTFTFKDEGDFITMLGSLRGELGGSQYMQHIHNSSAGSFPALDFGMERRLQETVIRGIEGNFIKSAFSIGSGGLSAAIATSLVYAREGLGARIHLSRKLLPAELLFGESQGVVLITLDENDLMEFERICMNVGVPSTTIGRVTDDGKFTFNDLINLPVGKIRANIPRLDQVDQ